MPTARSSTDRLATRRAPSPTSAHLLRFRARHGTPPGACPAGRVAVLAPSPRPSRSCPRSSRAPATAAGRPTFSLLIPTGVRGLPRAGRRLGGRLRRWPRAAARATRPSPTRSARPPTTSAPCCSPRSTSPGCSRPGCCSARRRTPSAPAPALRRHLVLAAVDRRRAPRSPRSSPGPWSRYAAARTGSPSCARWRGRGRWPGCALQLERPAHRRSWTGCRRCGSSSGGSTACPGAGRSPSSSRSRSWCRRSCSALCPPTSPPGGRRATSRASRARRRQPLPMPRSDLLALVRTDRASVWRTVPMRRGMLVLAIGPGLVGDRGQPAVAHADRPARPGRLGWRPPVRRQRLVPRRSGRPVAGEPAGPPAWCSPRAPGCSASSCCSRRRSRSRWPSLRAGMPAPAELTALALHLARRDPPGRGGRDALVPAAAATRSTCARRGPPRPRRC